MDCLKEIVGVTPHDTQCTTGGLTTEEKMAVMKSTSGLFLEDLPGGVTIKALRVADATRNLAQMGLDAINNAIKRTEDDLRISLSNKYQGNKNTYMGSIGRMSFAASLAVNKQIQGIRIKPNSLSDAVMVLNRINVVLNATTSINLQLWKAPVNSAVAVMVKEWPMNVTANQYHAAAITEPVVLPFMENGQAVEYWVVYDRGMAAPKDTKLDCSSCEAVSKAALYEYVDLEGVQLDSMTNLTNKSRDTYSHGIILDVNVRCESERLICREYDAQEAVSIAMSYAVWYKAGELLIEDVIKQPDVNRYTTMDRTYLWGKRNHFRAEYETRINYLASVIDVTTSNCYVCRQTSNQPFFGPILS